MRFCNQIKFILICIAFLQLISCGTSKSLHHKPEIEKYTLSEGIISKFGDTLQTLNNSQLLKNKYGIYEFTSAGNPLQIGFDHGKIMQPLVNKQEQLLFDKVKQMVPSKTKQYLLRQFLKWYNRKLYLHFPEEYKTEVFGVSKFMSNDYDFIAPKYLRSLYLHGAHDIGHAMQDLAVVGCSAFAVWDSKSEDGELLIGRNFDFYAGDEFAKEKVISFITPEKGNPYMAVSWAGMMGVMSGMNKAGLTVTINAGKSKIPLIAKAPISIVAREILQYATTIDEAITIAKQKQVFVSESLFIGSAKDKKAVTIEVSPDNFGVFESNLINELICTNHFQSTAYASDKRNQEHIVESHSKYRYDRIFELTNQKEKINLSDAVSILRNTKGLQEKNIGFGNEKALNQLLGHHSIIFKPESRLIWVSTSPYQLGEFICYDLNQIFSDSKPKNQSYLIKNKTIPADSLANSNAFKKYKAFRILDQKVDDAIDKKMVLSENEIIEYQNSNNDFWLVHYKIGKYYFQQKNLAKAKESFLRANSLEITTQTDKKNIEKYLRKLD